MSAAYIHISTYVCITHCVQTIQRRTQSVCIFIRYVYIAFICKMMMKRSEGAPARQEGFEKQGHDGSNTARYYIYIYIMFTTVSTYNIEYQFECARTDRQYSRIVVASSYFDTFYMYIYVVHVRTIDHIIWIYVWLNEL